MDKWSNRHFIKDIQMAHKHRKRCSTSWVTREMQTKTTVNELWHHTRGNNNNRWGCKEIGTLIIADGNVEWYSPFGKPGPFLKQINIELPCDPVIQLLGVNSRELKTYVHKKNLHTNIYSRIIHNNHKVKTTQISINWWVNQMWYIYTKEWTPSAFV